MKKAILWLKSTDGATAIEYGLLIVGISIALSAIVFAIGADITTIFDNANTKIQSRLD